MPSTLLLKLYSTEWMFARTSFIPIGICHSHELRVLRSNQNTHTCEASKQWNSERRRKEMLYVCVWRRERYARIHTFSYLVRSGVVIRYALILRAIWLPYPFQQLQFFNVSLKYILCSFFLSIYLFIYLYSCSYSHRHRYKHTTGNNSVNFALLLIQIRII